MKATKQQAERVAAKFGAIIETVKDPYERAVDIEATAPDGKQWTDGNCVTMIETYYTDISGHRERAFNTLIERMNAGLEEYSEELNG